MGMVALPLPASSPMETGPCVTLAGPGRLVCSGQHRPCRRRRGCGREMCRPASFRGDIGNFVIIIFGFSQYTIRPTDYKYRWTTSHKHGMYNNRQLKLRLTKSQISPFRAIPGIGTSSGVNRNLVKLCLDSLLFT